MEMHSPPRAINWQGNEADTPTDRLCRLMLRVHRQNDHLPGLQLDFGLNVVGNESVTRFDWNLCSALTDPDHGFY